MENKNLFLRYNMKLNEAKQYLNSKGYILEDTETQDDLKKNHLDLEDKVHNAYDFNIKNLFYGVEKELQKYYKKVDLEATEYDNENKSQLVRYYFKYNKNSYMLEVMYYDEDGVIVIQIMDEDEVGIERDDFSITTVDKAIKHIVDFANYNVV